MKHHIRAGWLFIGLAFCGSAWGQSASDTTNKAADSETTTLFVTSSPESSYVSLTGGDSTAVTPLSLSLQPGKYQLEVVKEGFEPLSHEFGLLAGQRISAQFILKSLPPPPLTVDSLELFYIPEKPLIDINDADQLGQSFKRMAEIFAIIPLGQGIIARMILTENDRSQAEILIGVGAVLSGGSLLLGKILSNHKRRAIEATNRRIEEENIASRNYNQDVDRQLKEKNEEAQLLWMKENEKRGRVVIESP